MSICPRGLSGFIQGAAVKVLPPFGELFQRVDASRDIVAVLARFLGQIVGDDGHVEFAENIEEFIRFGHNARQDDLLALPGLYRFGFDGVDELTD